VAFRGGGLPEPRRPFLFEDLETSSTLGSFALILRSSTGRSFCVSHTAGRYSAVLFFCRAALPLGMIGFFPPLTVPLQRVMMVCRSADSEDAEVRREGCPLRRSCTRSRLAGSSPALHPSFFGHRSCYDEEGGVHVSRFRGARRLDGWSFPFIRSGSAVREPSSEVIDG